jgi:hypothetical protein
MATHVLIHFHAAGLETSSEQDTRLESATPLGLRSSHGFVRDADTVYVTTASGLSAAKGVLSAIGLQTLLAASAWLMWQLVR